MQRATPARDIGDLVKLSIHAQFKKKIRSTIIELQEEQEQIESQNAKYQTFQDQDQGQPNNMRFLILQEIK